MKKISLLISVLFLSVISVQAQFKATPYGVSTIDGESFYIVDVPGKSAQELYSAVEAYFIAKFKNPDAVLNAQPGKMLNLHGIFPEAFFAINNFYARYADVDMNLVIRFKDNKIRFDTPVVNKMDIESLSAGGWEVVFSGVGYNTVVMFNKKGEVKKPEVVKSFNNFINGLISDIVTAVKSDASEEW